MRKTAHEKQSSHSGSNDQKLPQLRPDKSSLIKDCEKIDDNMPCPAFKKDTGKTISADKRGEAGDMLKTKEKKIDETKKLEKDREISQKTNISLLHSEKMFVPASEDVRILFSTTKTL